jgi:hypothetical protein
MVAGAAGGRSRRIALLDIGRETLILERLRRVTFLWSVFALRTWKFWTDGP